MGIQTFNTSPIKSVQRGVTGASGNVTISSVNMSKAVIYSKSKGSAGTVAATGYLNLSAYYSGVSFSENGGATNDWQSYSATGRQSAGGVWNPSYDGNLSGGTTNLTAKEYSATITNATTINCDGPVEWQVIEYA